MKRFLYLAQVEGDLPDRLRVLQSDDSDIRFVSWRTRSADPRGIFYPHSSWTEGRNRLFKEIAGTGYEYYIFLDDDVEMHVRDGRPGNGWRAFEAFLSEYEPAVGVARYMWHLQGGVLDLSLPVQGIRFFDALVNAFHREAVHALLPYYDGLDRYSECYSQSILCSQAAALYPGHVLQCNGVEVVNLHSRRPEREYLYCRAEDLFLASLKDPQQYAAFLRLTKSGLSKHVTLGEPQRKGASSYAIAEREVERMFDVSHPLWVRQRELAALPKASAFFSDRADTDRARAWKAEKASRLGPPMVPSWPERLRSVAVRGVQWSLHRSAMLRAINRGRKSFGHRVRQARANVHERQRRRLAAPADREIAARWARWRAEPGIVYDVPDVLTALRWCGWALSRIPAPHLTMMDVGGLHDDTVRGLVDAMPRQPILSIAVSAGAHPKYLHYGEFAMAEVSSGPEDPAIPRYRLSTLIRQFGLDRDVIHFLAIDAQASNLDALRSLDAYARACVCLRIRLRPADRAGVEALGFRLLAVTPAGTDQAADLLFVNVDALARQTSRDARD